MIETRMKQAINNIKEDNKKALVTTTSLTLLLDGCGNPTWSQVGANWSCHMIYRQLAPLGVLWLLHHNPFQWPFMASRHILPSLAFLANFHLTNPQAFTLDFGPGGFFCLSGVSRPPSHHHWFWATPLH
ncbi:hypothetical protein O181_091997 [Austropuccinia psidii MF-1]|uniref:Uncharacterized protein n=1 Tax=Austropuccinia psidii MF-1 TaxID=1389203 RepID=A0A9Q3IYB3_9BASI|nr:hypothetical protein [Austropuccinia psidii MF-1]